MFGTVTHFNAVKRYGFIRLSDQPADYFFHASEYDGDEAQLVKGTRVEFRLGEFKGKSVAREVRLLEAASPPSAAQRGVRAVLGGAA